MYRLMDIYLRDGLFVLWHQAKTIAEKCPPLAGPVLKCMVKTNVLKPSTLELASGTQGFEFRVCENSRSNSS